MLCFASSILSHNWYHFIGIRTETSYPLPRSELDHLVFHRYSSQSQHYDSFLLQAAGSNCIGQSSRMPQVLKDTWTSSMWNLVTPNMIRGGTDNICPHLLKRVTSKHSKTHVSLYGWSSHVSQNNSIYFLCK